ncbi:MAG: cell division protein FtsA [Saprospiraceae bacterium]|nr:cell division protein FtsA [Saprospiraceae bacterium]
MTNDTNISHQDVVVALDIGTTKVCALAGRRDEHGKIEILGMGRVASEGVSRGVVSNIDKTVKAISEAVRQAQRKVPFDIKVVYVGIAGQHIKSLQHRGIHVRENDLDEIRQVDIEKLVRDMHRLVLPPGDKILHVIPQEYTVDNEQGITDPIGMSGIRLEANFHIITGQIAASKNINRCIERVGLKVAEMTLEPIASAAAVLSDEEKDAGIALVDIGGGTTDITIFFEGIIRHTAVIPFGGNIISRDIKEGCHVTFQQAEKLKRKFGSALADKVFENRIITIPGLRGHEPKEISEKNLSLIIQARAEEILDYVLWEIKKSGFERKLIGGLVLTGGGSLLKDMEKLAQFHLGMSARLGLPIEHLAHGYADEFLSPVYSTGIGLLIKGMESIETNPEDYAELLKSLADKEKEKANAEVDIEIAAHERVAVDSGNTAWYERLFRKTKAFFEEEEFDKEF